eukprot:Hpha_TRINITY_DN18729_c0_g1::TRINITY_DN18729_c0_g1_i1::g.47349::m.47349
MSSTPTSADGAESLLEELKFPDFLRQLQGRLSASVCNASSGSGRMSPTGLSMAPSAHVAVLRYIFKTAGQHQGVRQAAKEFLTSQPGEPGSDLAPWAPLTPQRTSGTFASADDRMCSQRRFLPPTPSLGAQQADIDDDHRQRLGLVGCDMEDAWGPRIAPKQDPTALRILQWNLLADGLSRDGFCVNPVMEQWPYGRDKVPTTDGPPEEFSSMLQEMLAITQRAKRRAAAEREAAEGNKAELEERLEDIQEDKLEALAEFKRRFDTLETQQNLLRCVDWDGRLRRMLWVVGRVSPDIITMQEVDHLNELQAALEPLGYVCSVQTAPGQRAKHRPLHITSGAAALPSRQASGVAFSTKVGSEALVQKLERATESVGLVATGAVRELFEAAKLKPPNSLKDAVRRGPEFASAGGYEGLFDHLRRNGLSDLCSDSFDDDGSVVFWKADRFNLQSVSHCVFGEKDGGGAGEGAVKVSLHDRVADKDVSVCTTHLKSGNKMDQEAGRVKQLRGPVCSDTGRCSSCISWAGDPARPGAVIVAMDANSRPQFPGSETVWREFKRLGWASVWDEFFCPETGAERVERTPVTVNKLRGPSSGQTQKIGEHAFELIDHVFFRNLRLQGHGLQPVFFPSKDDALASLLPSLANPSDHYPVVADLTYA